MDVHVWHGTEIMPDALPERNHPVYPGLEYISLWSPETVFLYLKEKNSNYALICFFKTTITITLHPP